MLSYAQYTYSVHYTFLVALSQVAYGLIVTLTSYLLCWYGRGIQALPSANCVIPLTEHPNLSTKTPEKFFIRRTFRRNRPARMPTTLQRKNNAVGRLVRES
jgi:hypothetical protein